MCKDLRTKLRLNAGMVQIPIGVEDKLAGEWGVLLLARIGLQIAVSRIPPSSQNQSLATAAVPAHTPYLPLARPAPLLRPAGIIDVIRRVGFVFEGPNGNEVREIPVPQEYVAQMEETRAELIERVAEVRA